MCACVSDVTLFEFVCVCAHTGVHVHCVGMFQISSMSAYYSVDMCMHVTIVKGSSHGEGIASYKLDRCITLALLKSQLHRTHNGLQCIAIHGTHEQYIYNE